MIILALDMASTTGIAYGRPNTTPFATAIKAPSTGEDYGAWGGFFWRSFSATIRQLLARLEPGERLLVAFERPLLPPKRWDKKLNKMVGGTTLATTRKLHSQGVLLEVICTLMIEDEGAPIDIREVHVSEIKRELGGAGNAEKADLVFVARRAGIQLPPGAEAKDAADAFGAFLVAVRHWAPEHSAAWDRRIHSGEGLGLF